jgi:hypothetical protein
MLFFRRFLLIPLYIGAPIQIDPPYSSHRSIIEIINLWQIQNRLRAAGCFRSLFLIHPAHRKVIHPLLSPPFKPCPSAA